jgi:hypothetical protein
MFLVMTVQYNRVTSVKAFSDWHRATLHADTVAICLKGGVDKKMLNWEEGDYRNVYEHNGVAVMIEPCDEPSVEPCPS